MHTIKTFCYIDEKRVHVHIQQHARALNMNTYRGIIHFQFILVSIEQCHVSLSRTPIDCRLECRQYP